MLFERASKTPRLSVKSKMPLMIFAFLCRDERRWVRTGAIPTCGRLYAKVGAIDTNTAIRKMFGDVLVRALAASERRVAVIIRRLPKVLPPYRASKHAMQAAADLASRLR